VKDREGKVRPCLTVRCWGGGNRLTPEIEGDPGNAGDQRLKTKSWTMWRGKKRAQLGRNSEGGVKKRDGNEYTMLNVVGG